MAFSNKDLRAGDILVHENEVYCYLGYYSGRVRSWYYKSEEGYMYLYLDYLKDSYISNPNALQYLVHNNLSRLRNRNIDGHGCYTKSYKKFEGRLGSTDISTYLHLIQYCWGARRVGDKKPRG